MYVDSGSFIELINIGILGIIFQVKFINFGANIGLDKLMLHKFGVLS